MFGEGKILCPFIDVNASAISRWKYQDHEICKRNLWPWVPTQFNFESRLYLLLTTSKLTKKLGEFFRKGKYKNKIEQCPTKYI